MRLQAAACALFIAACAAAAGAATAPASASASASGQEAGDESERVAREAGPLSFFFPYREDYLDLPADQRDQFRLAYIVNEQGRPPPPETRLWYELDGARVDLIAAPDGRLIIPADQAFAVDPIVSTNQARGVLSLTMVFEPSAEPAARMEVSSLAGAVVQANRARRKVLGLAALFTPNMETVRISFEHDRPAPRAYAVFEDGRREALQAAENVILFQPGDRAMRGAERLEFERSPLNIRIDP